MYCINKSSEEFKNLVDKTGFNPRMLEIKIKAWQTANKTTAYPEPYQLGTVYEGTVSQSPGTFDDVVEGVRISRALEALSKISDMLQVPVKNIDAEQAVSILGNSYSGQKGFYVNKTAYVVGHFDLDTAFHELSHPFLEALSKSNKDLFNSLYDQVSESAQGKSIIELVSKEYPEKLTDSDEFKIEVMAYAMAQESVKKTTEPEMKSFIKNLIYNLRKLIRQVFGIKADASKLSPTTTFGELIDMLVKGDLYIETSLITPSEVAEYKKVVLRGLMTNEERLQAAKALAVNVNADPLDKGTITKEKQALLLDYNVQLIRKQIKDLKKLNDEELISFFTSKGSKKDMDLLSDQLSSVQNLRESYIGNLKNGLDIADRETVAMSTMLQGVEHIRNIVENIASELKNMELEEDDQETIARLHKFKTFFSQYESFIEQIEEMVSESGVKNTPFNLLISDTLNEINKAKRKIGEILSTSVSNILFEQISGINSNMEEYYKNRIEELEKNGAPQLTLDRAYREWYGLTKKEKEELDELILDPTLSSKQKDRKEFLLKKSWKEGLQMSKEKMFSTLIGELGDSSLMNSMMENFMMNQDTSIASFGMYLKRQYSQMDAEATSRYNAFQDKIVDLYEAAGYSGNSSKMADDLLFRDDVGEVGEDGSVVSKMRWKFLNPFKNYEKAIFEVNHKVNTLRAEYERDPANDEKKEQWIQAAIDKEIFMNKYFHGRFTPEYEAIREPLTRDRLGYEISIIYQDLLLSLRSIGNTYQNEEERLALMELRKSIEKKMKNLASTRDLYGAPKTGVQLEMAYRIQEYQQNIRNSKEPLRLFQTSVERFEAALEIYENELRDNNDPDFEEKRAKWIEMNTAFIPSPDVIKRNKILFEEIDNLYKELMKELNSQDSLNNFEKIQELKAKKRFLLAPYKDQYEGIQGKPMPSELRLEIRDIEIEIKKLEESSLNKMGLTPEETRLFYKKNLSGKELKLKKELEKKIKSYTKRAKDIIDEIKKKTSEKKGSYSTSFSNDYIDQLEDFIDAAEKKIDVNLFDFIKSVQEALPGDSGEFTPGKFAEFLSTNDAVFLIEDYLDNVPEFKETDFYKWFEENHIKNTVKGSSKFSPTSAWVVTESIVPINFETGQEDIVTIFNFTNSKGETEELINRTPIGIFSESVENPYYLNELVEGVTKDNKGTPLPRLDIEDKTFVNDDYFRLKQESPEKFAVLEELTKYHLSVQEGLDKSEKLGYELPRYQMDRDENLRSGKAVSNYVTKAKNLFKRKKDDFQEGVGNAEQEIQDGFTETELDIFGEESKRIPITGIFEVDEELLSKDIKYVIHRYMQSAVKAKTLSKALPLAQSLADIVEVNSPRDPYRVGRQNRLGMSKVFAPLLPKGQQSVRQKTINALINREFYGEKLVGAGANSIVMQKILGGMMSMSSFQFFALNIPSALKNQIGQKIQGAIKAASGDNFNMVQFLAAEAEATNLMMQISMNVRNPKSKPSLVMLSDLFDIEPGRTKKSLGQSASRNRVKDTLNGRFFMAPREWLQLQASAQGFIAYMSNIKIDQVQDDGTVVKIPYKDAFIKEGSQLVLKKGIDPEYGLIYNADRIAIREGKKLFEIKTKWTALSYDMNGVYDDLGQPLVDRYLAYKFSVGFKKFFTSMATDRFGFRGDLRKSKGGIKKRMSYAKGEAEFGWYVQTVATLAEAFKTKGKSLKHMEKKELQALKKVAAEMTMLALLYFVVLPMLGYDDDDPDRYKKLRENSGPLPIFFVSEDNEKFKFSGWMQNHLILMALSVEDEANSFNPLMGGTKDLLGMLRVDSIAVGATVSIYYDILKNMYYALTDDPQGFYQKDSGPYEWDKEGGAKFADRFAKMFGLNGGTIEPAQAVKNLVSGQKAGI